MVVYALKFTSGRYQGVEFPIHPNKEILIGRSPEIDLVLDEDKVSRKHAKISFDGTQLQIIDLGSTNGTYVNGERISRQKLKTNDRILIGTSIARIISGDEISLETQLRENSPAVKKQIADMNTRVIENATMSGTLAEVPLPDLLQLFCSNKKSGILIVINKEVGKIFLDEGVIVHAEIENSVITNPQKAFGKILAWPTGEFRLESLLFAAPRNTLAAIQSHELILEAVREIDELRQLREDLPSLDSNLALCIPMVPKLSELSAEELDILQSVLNFETIEAVIDASSLTEHAATVHIHKLLKEGYLEIDF